MEELELLTHTSIYPYRVGGDTSTPLVPVVSLSSHLVTEYVLIPGGLKVPARLYDQLYAHQRTGVRYSGDV